MPTRAQVNYDGSLADWLESDRIDLNRNSPSGYSLYARPDGDSIAFALRSAVPIAANTTFWLNTDRNASTGYQIFGFAGGAEYNVNIAADGTASLYSGAAGQTLVLSGLQIAYSADGAVAELRVPEAAIGTPNAVDIVYDVNDSVFSPVSYSDLPFTVFNDTGITPDPSTRIGIVYSQTTAQNYFSQTAYAQLFMNAQSQAMQAGVPFDLLTEADLTDLAKLARYDTLVFPSFRNVQASQVTAIANTLEQATRQFSIGLVASGEFMTNDAANNALPGDSYARMKLLFDATRVTGGFPDDVTIRATDTAGLVFNGYAPNEVIRSYQGVGWNAFTSVSGTGVTLATETVGGQTYAAALATQTGGRNVLFSSDSVMADSNLLWQAIDYSAGGAGVTVGLQMTRQSSLVAARFDMDSSMFVDDVNPEGSAPGVYDKMLPVLASWKSAYNFVGSYYLNIGDNPANGEYTDWAVSLPYYKRLIDLGGEIGTHSYTHPENTNLLTPAQIAREFGDGATVLEQRLSAYLGRAYNIVGAAVPGAPETLPTTVEIMKNVDRYLSGGYSGVGAGYPNAFGFLSPELDDKVYLAPNTSFDFSLVEFRGLTIPQAEAAWAQEWAELTAKAETPIVVWPIHDYALGTFDVNGTGASPYTTQMFTNWVARASSSGAEFVTLADLADRITAFQAATVTSSVSGNVVTATVSSSNAGRFALDIDGQGSSVIRSVAGWYAYDADSVFLPATGGTFTVTLGAAADDVTHITALPMRASLLSVTGNGRNLSFSVDGEGLVTVDLQQPGTDWVSVAGATVASRSGEIVTLDLGAAGRHDVTISYGPNTAPVITSNGGGVTAFPSVAENVLAVTTVVATDPNAGLGDRVGYSIVGGLDAALFNIDAVTGALSFRAAPDYEAPTDANRDNVYLVTVAATDTQGAADRQDLSVRVTNVVPLVRTGGFGGETIAGTSEGDTISGGGGNDTLSGLGGADRLNGDDGNDRIDGGDGDDLIGGGSGVDIMGGGLGNDVIVGGANADVLTGGAGADLFRYLGTGDSGTSLLTRDAIVDFTRGQDRIDLSAIDANTSWSAPGNQAFTRLAFGGAFTAPGQLRYYYASIAGVEYTVVEGNVDSGTGADFSIALLGHQPLTVTDFIL